MDDAKKTKSMLIRELQDLRQDISHMERIIRQSSSQLMPKDQIFQLYKLAVEEAPVSIWACDRNWKIAFWNPGAEKIYLSKSEDVVGKSFLELFINDQDREQAIIDLQRVFDGEAVQGYVAEDRLPDGTTRTIYTTIYPIYNDAGEIYLQAEIGLDITEQRKAEEILKNAIEIGGKLTLEAQLSEEGILEFINFQASKLMDTSNMYIALYDDENDIVSFGFAMYNGERVDVANDPGWQPRKSGFGLTEHVIRTQKAYRPRNVEEAYNTFAKHYVGIMPKSWMGIPLIVKGKVMGVIVLINDNVENCYSEHDQLILQTIADYSSIAIQNTRLYQQLTRRIDELEVLKGLSDSLSAMIVS